MLHDGSLETKQQIFMAFHDPRRLGGRVKHCMKPGPKPYLTNKEAQLSSHLLAASHVGFSKTRHELKYL